MTTKLSEQDIRLITTNKNRIAPLHFPKSDKDNDGDEDYQKFLRKYDHVININRKVDLYKESQKSKYSVKGLPQHIIIGFQEYVDRNNIYFNDYEDTIPIYINRLDASSKTKRAYRNRLRALLNNITVKETGENQK